MDLSQEDALASSPPSSSTMEAGEGKQVKLMETVAAYPLDDDMTELTLSEHESNRDWRDPLGNSEHTGRDYSGPLGEDAGFSRGSFMPITQIMESKEMEFSETKGEDDDNDDMDPPTDVFGNIVEEINRMTRKVHGREAEKEELLKCWRRCNRYTSQEFVLISGSAGLGKSTLANSLRTVIDDEEQMSFFISAKFGENNHHSKGPYDVFVSAFSDYVHQLFETGDANLIENVKQKLKAAVKRDRKHLVQVIPAFERILVRVPRRSATSLSDASSVASGGSTRTSASNRSRGHKTQIYGSESAYRLRSAFVKAVAAVCSVTPLTLFLDDIQWAGVASLDLLRSLIQSTGSIPLLLIGCRRELSVDTDQLIAAGVDVKEGIIFDGKAKDGTTQLDNVLNAFEADDSVRLTRIELSNLRPDSVVGLVAEVLRKDPSEAAELSASIHMVTNGNVFHLFQVLRYLVDKEIIAYSEEGEWTWDGSAVQECLMAPNSVLELVLGTIKSQSQEVQEALKVASCLGSEVDAAAIDVVLLTQSGPHLEQAASAGLLTKTDRYGVYRFSHDWIRHAAYSLIPEKERAAFHHKLGRRLWKSSSNMGLDQNVMLIVSLMNVGSDHVRDKRERYKLADLNLKAGKKALSMPSFPDAARFLRKGIEYLGEDCWEEKYSLSLELYSNAAEIETINGNFEFVSTCINEVVKNGRNLDDKIQAYAALLTSMEQQDDLEEATAVCADVVGKLGETLPPRASKLTAAKEFFKVRFALRGKSDKELMSMPMMADDKKRKCMEFLSLGFVAAWRSKSPMSALFAFRAVRLSLKYGLHNASSLAFAVYGATLCGLHIDVHEGFRMGQLAIRMAERSNSLRFLSHSLNFGAGCVTHWTQNVDRTIEYIEHSRVVGMDSGHVGPGCQAWLLSNLYQLVTGKNLSVIQKSVKQLLQQTRMYRQRGTEISSSLVLQLIDCYAGAAGDPSRPTGTVIDYESTLLESKNCNDQVGVLQHYMVTMELCYMFGDLDEAGRMADLINEGNSGSSPTLTAAMLQFLEALVALAQLKRGVQRAKNRKRATKFIGNFVKWSKDGPETFEHVLSLLEAEMKSITSPSDEKWIISRFNHGYLGAEKVGNMMIMALSCERLGDFLGGRGRKTDAIAQWKRAAEIYSEWGGMKKSRILREKMAGDDFERDIQAAAESQSKTCI
eukprot:CAMPEP_0168719300 /NCGR_PEP_ID=MMETSP0724-20121128/965_1 /TAXON_ID=265536 /ORGANISM="Amphiprora sp., Strain CCMP467" /LENGTH=1183 /DNA_ID=CAMNT_0008765845 /DNA_START=1 /DNA_END=3552 /DNA_ORIENTATION=-